MTALCIGMLRTCELLVLEEGLNALREQVPVDGGSVIGVELQLLAQRLQRRGLGRRLCQPPALELLPQQPPGCMLIQGCQDLARVSDSMTQVIYVIERDNIIGEHQDACLHVSNVVDSVLPSPTHLYAAETTSLRTPAASLGPSPSVACRSARFASSSCVDTSCAGSLSAWSGYRLSSLQGRHRSRHCADRKLVYAQA